ncbi:MAG TPA: hypothetical protein VNB29_07415 [Chthoniobacterales bacterium]|nr:hypothetical protein [Chthoniobacterales bacterium]
MQQDWEIKSRSHNCTRSGKPFEEGEFFYTLLFRDEAGFHREDISEESWNTRNDNIQPFSFWRTKYEPPAPPPPEPLKKNDAESLLRALVETGDPQYQNAIYILALMLERKRALRPVDAPDDDTLIYEIPSTGETFILRNPHLSMDQIPAVQQEVAGLLDASLGVGAPAAAPMAAPEASPEPAAPAAAPEP